MEQSELEKIEDELHALQYRIEQSIRFFFRNQRNLFLENFRSTNDVRSSMENTVISGTGNSGNTWQVYLTEEPRYLNWFYFSSIVIIFWLIIAILHIRRTRNERRSNVSRNSMYVSNDSINLDSPPPNNSSEVENNDQNNEIEPPLPQNDVDENDTNSSFTENSAQQIANNIIRNESRREVMESLQYENNITEGENNATDEATRNDIAEKSEPSSSHSKTNSFIANETPDQRKDAGNQTEDEVKSEATENNLTTGLPNEHQKQSRSSSCDEVTATEKSSGSKNDENKKIEIDVKKVQQPHLVEESTLLPSGSKINNLPKSKNVTAIKICPTKTDNENKEPIKADSTNGLFKDNQEKPECSSSAVINDEDMKNVKENITKANVTEKPRENKNNASKSSNSDVTVESSTLSSEIKTSDLTQSQNFVPTEVSDCATDKVLKSKDKVRKVSVKTDSKESLPTTDPEKPKDSSSKVATNKEDKDNNKNLKNSNIIEESKKLPSESKTSNLPKPQNVVATKASDPQAGEVLKTKDNEKKDLVQRDSKDGLTTSDEKGSKDLSSVVASNEDAKKTIENNMETNATEKLDIKQGECKTLPSENKTRISPKSQNVTAVEIPDPTDQDLKAEDDKNKKVNIVEESKTLPSENKTSQSPNSQNANVVETSDSNTVEVVKTNDEEKRKSVQKDPTDGVVNEDQKKPEGVSSGATKNESVKNSTESSEEENSTEKSVLEKDKVAGNIDESKTLLSENKTSNSPISPNATITKTSDSHTDEVVKTKNKEKKDSIEKDSKNALKNEDQVESKNVSSVVVNDEDKGNVPENSMNTNTTEKLDVNEIEDNKETEVTLLKTESNIGNIEKSNTLPSENKTSNSPKLQIVTATETSESRKVEVVKTNDEEKKTEDMNNVPENKIEANATEKLSQNKSDDNIKGNDNLEKKTEISNIEESTTLILENKSSNSPKSQNVPQTPDSHTDEVVKTQDENKIDIIDQHLVDKLVKANQELISFATETFSEIKTDEKLEGSPENNINANVNETVIEEVKENLGDAQEVPKVDITEKSAILPSARKISNSSEPQNISDAETLTEEDLTEIKTETENKTGDAQEKECDLGSVNETVNNDKSLILSCESKIGDISNLQSEIVTKSSDLEENEVVITQNEEEKIEISSNAVETASEATEADTNAEKNENEIKDVKSEEQNTEAAGGIENIENQEDTFDVTDKNPSSSGSDPEDQGTNPEDQGTNPEDQGTNPEDQGTSSSNPNNSTSSGNDTLHGGQRKNRKKKKGKKSNRY